MFDICNCRLNVMSDQEDNQPKEFKFQDGSDTTLCFLYKKPPNERTLINLSIFTYKDTTISNTYCPEETHECCDHNYGGSHCGFCGKQTDCQAWVYVPILKMPSFFFTCAEHWEPLMFFVNVNTSLRLGDLCVMVICKNFTQEKVTIDFLFLIR